MRRLPQSGVVDSMAVFLAATTPDRRKANANESSFEEGAMFSQFIHGSKKVFSRSLCYVKIAARLRGQTCSTPNRGGKR
jgi:hypothetical protein